ncbi:MAG: hypothetical protein KKA79_01185 [Nanoarchaeota archaeon]|nr:hypothetical protein [Nanoarchaeota archaeon]
MKFPKSFRPEKNLEDKTQNLIEEPYIIETDSIVLEGDVEALLMDRRDYGSTKFDETLCSFLKREDYKEHPKSSKKLSFWSKENYNDHNTLDVFVRDSVPYDLNPNHRCYSFANVDNDRFDLFRRRMRNNLIINKSLNNKYTRNIAAWGTAITGLAAGVFGGVKLCGWIFNDPGWILYGLSAFAGMFAGSITVGFIQDLDLDTEITNQHYKRRVVPVCNEMFHYEHAIRKAFGVKIP